MISPLNSIIMAILFRMIFFGFHSSLAIAGTKDSRLGEGNAMEFGVHVFLLLNAGPLSRIAQKNCILFLLKITDPRWRAVQPSCSLDPIPPYGLQGRKGLPCGRLLLLRNLDRYCS